MSYQDAKVVTLTPATDADVAAPITLTQFGF